MITLFKAFKGALLLGTVALLSSGVFALAAGGLSGIAHAVLADLFTSESVTPDQVEAAASVLGFDSSVS